MAGSCNRQGTVVSGKVHQGTLTVALAEFLADCQAGTLRYMDCTRQAKAECQAGYIRATWVIIEPL